MHIRFYFCSLGLYNLSRMSVYVPCAYPVPKSRKCQIIWHWCHRSVWHTIWAFTRAASALCPPPSSLLLILFIVNVFMCLTCVAMTPWYTCGGQKSRSLLPPFCVFWVLNTGCQVYITSNLTCWTISLALLQIPEHLFMCWKEYIYKLKPRSLNQIVFQ